MMKLTTNRYAVPSTRYARHAGFLVVCLLFFVQVNAQLKRVPLERPLPAEKSVKASSGKRTQSETPLILPFFDDFSSTPAYRDGDPYSGHPSTDRWVSSFSVWVNEGLGVNPPSVNVATFDGLDSAGVAYSNQVLENGFRDVLTSRLIDLSTDYVGLGERNGVYLSFFYQWQGNGESPDPGDFLRVEFLNADSVWEQALTITPEPELASDQFYQAIVQVNGERFFTKEFRFRFRNYGRRSGPYDTWNLDYVYLNKSRNPENLTYPDRAIASSVGPVFGPYFSIPVEHFREAPIYNPPQVDIQSLRSGPAGAPTDYTVNFRFDNRTGTATTRVDLPFGPVGSKYPDNNLLPGERFRSTIRTTSNGIDLNDPSFNKDAYFLPAAERIDVKISLGIFEPDAGMFASNDTISQVYHLHDYYAYDDGSAEYAVTLTQADDQVAYGFDVLVPGPRTLVGFDVYIPAYSISGFTTGQFFVMDADANGEPNDKLTTVTYIVRKQDRNGFQRVNIEPVIVNGTFFIGWRGSASNAIRVGMDYSNNTVNRIFEDLNGIIENGKLKWYPVASLTEGSIMIRPNFGEGGPISGVHPEAKKLTLYPNPSRGVFRVSGRLDAIELISVSGQAVPFERFLDSEDTTISLRQPVPGMYILRGRLDGTFVTSKVIIH